MDCNGRREMRRIELGRTLFSRGRTASLHLFQARIHRHSVLYTAIIREGFGKSPRLLRAATPGRRKTKQRIKSVTESTSENPIH